MTSSREKFLVKNTLVCLLKALEGRVTTVELRNENTITGQIDEVDGFMCISMSNVCFKTLSGRMANFESFYIQGKNIRYVQIPDEINMRKAMEYEVNKERIRKLQIQRGIRKAAMQKMQKRQKTFIKNEQKELRQKEAKELAQSISKDCVKSDS